MRHTRTGCVSEAAQCQRVMRGQQILNKGQPGHGPPGWDWWGPRGDSQDMCPRDGTAGGLAGTVRTRALGMGLLGASRGQSGHGPPGWGWWGPRGLGDFTFQARRWGRAEDEGPPAWDVLTRRPRDTLPEHPALPVIHRWDRSREGSTHQGRRGR